MAQVRIGLQSLQTRCLSPLAFTRIGGARYASAFFESYNRSVDERLAQGGIPPRPIDAAQCTELVALALDPKDEADQAEDLLVNRVPPGVDEAAYVKAGFLTAIANGETSSPLFSKERSVELLGTMQGGYCVTPLVSLLDDAELGALAAKQLQRITLVYDAYYDILDKHKAGNTNATAVLQSWADAEWFTANPELPEKYAMTVFKVPGETNTDDLSPAPDAPTRPDIPLHALAMLKIPRDGITDCQAQIAELKAKGFPLVYTGDVVGTGSSRKSATNSVLWYMGDDIPYLPNKRGGGVCIGNKIAPIFYNTMEDAGALPLEMDVSQLTMGRVIDIWPNKGVVTDHETGEELSNFQLKTEVLRDEVRAGGRIPLIIGRNITSKARKDLDLPPTDIFRLPAPPAGADDVKGYTLAQKMVGKACGLEGVLPGQFCEPAMTTVGSQDTTGPMTRDELKDLACLGFSADLVMQSFCHTAAYPKPSDVAMQFTLPDFIRNRGGVSLKVGDGIIHSWLNRMLIPDAVGTGGDSHTRFPLGISFPAGSGLVAFAATTGVMPLDMPESVRVRFTGEVQPGITLRDLVHAIPLQAIKEGQLTVPKQNKINVFNGRVLEIEGLSHLKCEQAFELSDASAERSAAGCSITLDEEPIAEYLTSNIVMLKWMITEGYGDARTIERRIARMEAWLADPKLMRADDEAEYAYDMTIDMNEIKEPIVCCPNDPDDAKTLSDVQGTQIDEVFIGSCMTNIGHFRAAGNLLEEAGTTKAKLWVAPPTKMDAAQLHAEGYYYTYGRVGARTEMPGCSLCMGNQARVADKSTCVSTSTRNFPNRLGNGADVYLASAELAAVAAIMGKLPTFDEYIIYQQKLDAVAAETYKYLNFDQLPDFVESASKVTISEDVLVDMKKLHSA
jgi:aconitate hydratase 2/2-methylisocitrate dehydratase